MSDITYAMYLEAVGLGLNPHPKTPVPVDVCRGISCENCHLKHLNDCTTFYFNASKTTTLSF